VGRIAIHQDFVKWKYSGTQEGKSTTGILLNGNLVELRRKKHHQNLWKWNSSGNPSVKPHHKS
jgi:hypothetical protein